MDDFLDDDALLAMVGDESEGNVEATGSTREPSTSPPPKRSTSRDSSPARQPTESSSSKPQPRSNNKMSTKSSAKRRRGGESDDEGEASDVPGSPASLGSDAMDESDSDDAPNDGLDTADQDNPYPYKGQFRNASDEAYVMGLPMLEREALLAERGEEAQAKRRGMQLKSLLDSSAADKSKKRKAQADLEDDRHPARPKTSREKVLDSYKQQREQAKEGGRRRTSDRRDRRSRSREDMSSRDASGSPDFRRQVPAPLVSKELDYPVELEDVERLRLGRTNLARYCFNPKFDTTMIGCFARVCIGQNPDRQNEYRMTVIKGIVTGQPYLVDASPVVPRLYTDQYVLLAHGNAQKQWPFNNCSDSKFTEREFNRWKAACTTDAIPYPSRAESHKLCDNINTMINHHLTSSEINEKVAKRDKYSHMFAESAPAPKRTNADDAAEKIRMRNEKIRKQDAEDRRKEFSAKIRAKNALMKKAQIAAKAAKANGEDETTLKVPKNEIDALFSEGSDVSRAASPAPSGARTPQQGSKHRTGRFTKMTMDDDVIGDMGLTIDVEI